MIDREIQNWIIEENVLFTSFNELEYPDLIRKGHELNIFKPESFCHADLVHACLAKVHSSFKRCLTLLGHGADRVVYLHPTHPGYIIKVNKRYGEFKSRRFTTANQIEWYIWENHLELREYLVPCIDMSLGGECLVMPLGTRVSNAERQEVNFPSVLTDVDSSNCKKIGNRVLMCDYGDRNILDNLGVVYIRN